MGDSEAKSLAEGSPTREGTRAAKASNPRLDPFVRCRRKLWQSICATLDELSLDAKPRAGQKPVQREQTETDSREQLIVELRDAVRARDDFLGVLAHELRYPLTPILL